MDDVDSVSEIPHARLKEEIKCQGRESTRLVWDTFSWSNNLANLIS